MKITKLILQVAALICSVGLFAYMILNVKSGSLLYYFIDDYFILAALSLLLIIGFNRDKWRSKYELYENTAISISSFAMFVSSLFHCFVVDEYIRRTINIELITISVMNILPFAIFAFAMIKTIYKKDGQIINNALPIVSLIIMLAFGVASYHIENQSKHWIAVAVICSLIIGSRIIENRILNKEALQDE